MWIASNCCTFCRPFQEKAMLAPAISTRSPSLRVLLPSSMSWRICAVLSTCEISFARVSRLRQKSLTWPSAIWKKKKDSTRLGRPSRRMSPWIFLRSSMDILNFATRQVSRCNGNDENYVRRNPDQPFYTYCQPPAVLRVLLEVNLS